MSNTQISFQAKVRIGEEIIPLASEIAFGDTASQDGVENGFLFKLDRQPGELPVVINLGAIIAFIEQKLQPGGAAPLSQNPALKQLQPIFGDAVASGSNFNGQNQTLIEVREFTINSTKEKFLFSISIDIGGSDPSQGLIALPGELAKWVRIKNLAIAFQSTTTKTPTLIR